MKLYISAFLVANFHLMLFKSNLQYTEAQQARAGTTCYKCENSRNVTKCMKETVQCASNEKSCKTTIRRVNGELRTTMKCAQTKECKTDEKQNEQNCPVKCVYCCASHRCLKNQQATEENCPSTRKGCRKIISDEVFPLMPCDKAVKEIQLSNEATINITGELRSFSSFTVITNSVINSTVDLIKTTEGFRLFADGENFHCLKVFNETLLRASNNNTQQLKRDSLTIILRCYWEGKPNSVKFISKHSILRTEEWSGEGSLFSGELYDGVSGEYVLREDGISSSTVQNESVRSIRATSSFTRPTNESVEFLITCFFLESSQLNRKVEPRAERLAACRTVQYLECVFIMKPLLAALEEISPQQEITPAPQEAHGLGVAVISSISAVSALAGIICLVCGVKQWKKHSKRASDEEN